MRRPSMLVIVYLVIGVVVAVVRDYVDNLDNIKGIASAALAIVLWPLVLLGVNVRIGKNGGKDLLVPIAYSWTWLRGRLWALRERRESM